MTIMLENLLALLPDKTIKTQLPQELAITDITCDSRKIKPGALFICLSGSRVDGHAYVEQAYQAGAAAVLTEKAVAAPAALPVIEVPDTRQAMQLLVPYFFGYPGKKMRMIGVTGTNGKTTTTYVLRHILQEAGYKVGVIGTIQIMIGEEILPVANTTPDVVELQSVLARMAAAEIDYVVMEVSSHALALDRVAGCEFDTAIFTNMTQDHLDFHGDFPQYLAAKTRLFELLSQDGTVKSGKTAIINVDDVAGRSIIEKTSCAVTTYAIEAAADLQAVNTDIRAGGCAFTIAGPFGRLPLQLAITGYFNVYNVLGAVGAAIAEGVEPAIIKRALERFTSVPGRFELVDGGQPFSIIVDYAHTPDGLENILKTAQQIAKQRIIVVFGCGGDRDRTKRPIMGRLAVQYGDIVIATSDNPRSEEPEAILADIEKGIQNQLTAGKHYEKITDRRQAITKAITLAQPDDIVIIAGKGHETYQILKDRTIHFDDRETAREILKEMK